MLREAKGAHPRAPWLGWNEEVPMADTRRDGEPVGHADSPRQDTQRPDHHDGPDAGGQESSNTRARHTQLRPGDTPAGVEPPSGTLHEDAPVPSTGRQPERPGHLGVAQDRLGARDADSLDPQVPDRDRGKDAGRP
jgi:hypothetical protein